jgi:hypothetical protein
MNYWLLMTGSFISFLGLLIHGILGTRIYMGNINKSGLDSLTKSLSLVSWHVFTIFLFIGTIILITIAYNPEYGFAAYPVIIINALGALLFFFLGLGNHRMLLRMPGGYLMAFTAIFSYLGIIL